MFSSQQSLWFRHSSLDCISSSTSPSIRPQTAACVSSWLRAVNNEQDITRPQTSPGALGRTFDPSISTSPSPEPHIKPANPGLRVRTQIEQYIDAVLVPLLREAVGTYSVSVLCIHGQNTILVLVDNPSLLSLPLDSICDYKITKGQGSAKIYVQGEFADTSVGNRISVPAIGASLAAESSSTAGSLGLYVQNRSTKTLYAMTCYHCVMGNSASQMIVSPAPDDLKHIQQRARRELSEAEEEYLKLIELGRLRYIRRAESSIEDLSELLVDCQRDCRLGPVSKYFQTCKDREYLDVALIQIRPERLDGWSAPELNDPLPKFWIGPHHDSSSKSRFMKILEPENVASTDKLELLGRTSGFTTGRLNPIQIRAAMETPFGLMQDFLAWGAISDKKYGSFSQGGDSGSVIYKNQSVVGMMFGGINGHDSHGYGIDITLFTPVSRLFNLLELELP